MKSVVLAFTEQGARIADRIAVHLGEGCMTTVSPSLAGTGNYCYSGRLTDYIETVFDADLLVFVGAVGIAVRAVAPHVKNKTTDPAVVCVDELGHHVIPILSGHIGGANAFARDIADTLGGVAIITTATDIHGRFSVDTFAAEHRMAISDMGLAKRVSLEILKRDVPFFSDGPCPNILPEGLIFEDKGELGICVSIHPLKPFQNTLLLVPRVLQVGIGCRKGVDERTIERAIRTVLKENDLCTEAIAGVASIDIKSKEQGLIACCRKNGWPLVFYTAEQLKEVPGRFSVSEFVLETVGVGCVCERAAAMTGQLIVNKTILDSVTVAVSEAEWRLAF
ncbi:MAG: cobalamin biosynthesis protein [Clostridia bacterium]|nr:cobalamin biosynthesis protein [Clostridia bacterium]